MSYTPPINDAVDFKFAGGYVAPAGHALYFSWESSKSPTVGTASGVATVTPVGAKVYLTDGKAEGLSSANAYQPVVIESVGVSNGIALTHVSVPQYSAPDYTWPGNTGLLFRFLPQEYSPPVSPEVNFTWRFGNVAYAMGRATVDGRAVVMVMTKATIAGVSTTGGKSWASANTIGTAQAAATVAPKIVSLMPTRATSSGAADCAGASGVRIASRAAAAGVASSGFHTSALHLTRGISRGSTTVKGRPWAIHFSVANSNGESSARGRVPTESDCAAAFSVFTKTQRVAIKLLTNNLHVRLP